jgi:hypothetical protein
MPPAQETKPKVNKILIPPPRGGLNLHDNPLELNPIYATELTNFMPPTSTLEVRPAIERIIEINGQVRGMYSYTRGAIQVPTLNIEQPYREWSEFALDKIIIKLLSYDGTTKIYELDPKTNMVTPIIYDYITNRSPSFSNDSAVFMNSLFFLDGGNQQIPYVYNEQRGLNKMAWTIPATETVAATYVENIDNLVMYKGFLYANEIGTLKIYYINAQSADIESESNWILDGTCFSPTITDWFNLNGVLQMGGEIFRIDTISNTTNNSVTCYLVVISTNGEMLVYDGTSPADIANWKLVGNFKIPIPLNKFCFCKMEGDIVVATQNGLVSLQRVIFGGSTQITEALEWRLSSLFNDYSFTNVTLKDFFFLQYFQTDRLLIFNVPIQVPCRFDGIKAGYKFNDTMNLLLTASSMNDNITNNTFYAAVQTFILEYVIKMGASYKVDIYFNYKTNTYVELFFENTSVIATTATIYVYFRFNDPTYGFNFFESSRLVFTSAFESGSYRLPILNEAQSKFLWNSQFKITDPDEIEKLGVREAYKIPIKQNLEVTSIKVSEQIKPVLTGVSSAVDTLLEGAKIDGNLNMAYSINNCSKIVDRYQSVFIEKDLLFSLRSYVIMNSRPEGYNPMINGPISFNHFAWWHFLLCIQEGKEMFDGQGVGKTKNPDAWSYIGYVAERNVDLSLLPKEAAEAQIGSPYNFKYYNKTIITSLHDWYNDLELSNSVTGQKVTTQEIYDSPGVGAFYIYQENTFSLGNQAYYRYSIKRYFTNYQSSFFTGGDLAYGQPGYAAFNLPVFDTVKWKTTKNDDKFSNLAVFSRNDVINGNIEKLTFTTNIPDAGYPVVLPQKNMHFTIGSATTKYDIKYKSSSNGRSPAEWGLPAPANIYGPTQELTRSGLIFNDTVVSPTPPTPTPDFTTKMNNWMVAGGGALMGSVIVPVSTDTVKRSNSANIDLSIVPFINQINIDCAYKSDQYVMNSHYGTWAKWEDVNMVTAISHMDKFYFVTLTDESISPELNIKKCYLNTFNKEFNGDLNIIPIKASYKSGHSDFGIPNQKLFKKVKVYGSTPTFWGEESNKVPYEFMYDTDFKTNDNVQYMYTSRAITPKDIGILKSSRNTLDPNELQAYLDAYSQASKQIRFIELPITANPATRISIGSQFSISEHNIIVYGYELYYVVVLP